MAFSIAETDNLLLAREKIIQWRPNLVIADFTSFASSLHNVQQLSSIYSACGKSIRLMLLNSMRHVKIEEYCLSQGSHSIYSKSTPLPELYAAIQTQLSTRPPFHTGQQYTSPLLTLREERILKLWTDEANNDFIARMMGISTKTVYTYKRNIRMKLGINNRFSLFIEQHQ
ncbi:MULTISPECIES: response regulator transcription factor [Buttiauxella]|jgi:DNA-binding CsgD family transcriptional regulator|uniref:Signal transduction response regulator n=2 Tax=Buttiauxella ferragutiae TaxID=82989 RepID=A0ABX2WDE9_9ENTR|nr:MULTISPECIES: LuxR C-terminal-related transcriptional regulator [Buttiauxella]MCE0828154.1 LuxR C-terminal-related transcriptional regulator [Buttiauxella ferragutiae]OAT32591.1 signal transduction response regulator [Buttiauxella ferragutiae ATCC 51602]TDN49383.1 DNA-binding NarL/FixJ family response regulator [Buttiauxella sp. JUb87]